MRIEVSPKYSKSQRATIDLALKAAANSGVKQRHAAVITKNGRVLAIGINKYRNDPKCCLNGDTKKDAESYSYHAEDVAIRMAGDNCKNATITVVRINRRGEPMYSAPCPSCAQKIAKSGIKTIIHT